MCFDLTLICHMEGREMNQEDERWWEPRHGATGRADGVGAGGGADGGVEADGGEAGTGAGMDMGRRCFHVYLFADVRALSWCICNFT